MTDLTINDLYNIKIALSYYANNVVVGTDREEEYRKSFEKICLIIDERNKILK